MADAGRLGFALRNVQPRDRDAFERLCGAFLADEFPELRRIGGVGDKGGYANLKRPIVPERDRAVQAG
jgi:hypothetical protein